MNILILSKLFAKSGVGTHIKDLAQQLIKKGHVVHLLSSTNEWGNFCEEQGVHFQYVDFSLSPLTIAKTFKEIYI